MQSVSHSTYRIVRKLKSEVGPNVSPVTTGFFTLHGMLISLKVSSEHTPGACPGHPVHAGGRRIPASARGGDDHVGKSPCEEQSGTHRCVIVPSGCRMFVPAGLRTP